MTVDDEGNRFPSYGTPTVLVRRRKVRGYSVEGVPQEKDKEENGEDWIGVHVMT